jgi:DNA (cytosine-5)-methyltransferase 1
VGQRLAVLREAFVKLLDLYCKAGGAAEGYHRAGFEVTGVDIEPQPRFRFRFVQADALEYLREHGHEYDAIHASPPCQAFTQMSAKYRGKGGRADSHPDLLTPTRAALVRDPRPWVIENVVGARRRMQPLFTLHGGMFGLGVHRPRLFEANVLMMPPVAPHCAEPIGVYGTKPDGRTLWRYRNSGMWIDEAGVRRYKSRSPMRAPRSLEEAQRAMGIDWMEWDELREAIPPAYTEWIGRHLMAVLEVAA